MAERPEIPTESTRRTLAEPADDPSTRPPSGDRRRPVGDPEAIAAGLRRPGPAFGFDLEAGD